MPEAFWFPGIFKGLIWVHWPEMGQYEQVPNSCCMIMYKLI